MPELGMLYNFIMDILPPVAIGGGAAALTIKFIGKNILKQLLEKEIIKYKSQLEEKQSSLKQIFQFMQKSRIS